MSTTTKVLAVALAFFLVAAGAYFALGAGLVGSAAATADGDTYASVTKLEGESYNGQVEEIYITTTGYVEWSDLPSDAETVHVEMEAKVDGEWQTFATETYDADDGVPSSSDGDFSYDEVTGRLLDGTDFDGSDFSAGEDGEVRKEYVTVRVTVTDTDEHGEVCEFSQVHKVKTVVENLVDPSANGETDIDGEIVMDDADPECDCFDDGDDHDYNGRY